jgi:hypothetical protein
MNRLKQGKGLYPTAKARGLYAPTRKVRMRAKARRRLNGLVHKATRKGADAFPGVLCRRALQ